VLLGNVMLRYSAAMCSLGKVPQCTVEVQRCFVQQRYSVVVHSVGTVLFCIVPSSVGLVQFCVERVGTVLYRVVMVKRRSVGVLSSPVQFGDG